jgi:hypothetical protein
VNLSHQSAGFPMHFLSATKDFCFSVKEKQNGKRSLSGALIV